MPPTATVLGSKTLPSALSLHSSSPSPHHPLIALASPSTSSESKVSLYRTGGNSDLVWEWTNVGEPPKPTGGGLGALKGKAKASPVGKVQQLAWSPRGERFDTSERLIHQLRELIATGNFLAVAISPATSSSSSTLAILSIHDGKPLSSPPTPLPTSSDISHLSWQSLDYAVDSSLSSWSIDLVRKFPGLPKLGKDSSGGSSGSGQGGSGSSNGPALGNFAANPGAGGPGGGGGGVFGAKQAMLERERAKEAQRVLNLREATSPGGFPSVLSDVRPDELGGTGDEKVKAMLRVKGERHDETERSILCVGDEEGKLHLYLGGSVYLGTVDAGGEGNGIVGIRVLPSTSTSSTVRFLVQISSAETLVCRQLSLPIPSSLELVIRQSSAIRSTIQHAFEALQEVRNLWDESRRIGKGWLQRVADVSRPQGVVLPPSTQLHLLLMTGRPTRSLHDFLASKMNERGLVKWEQEMGLALDRMKRVGWMSVVPALERTIVLLLEVDAWARWPDKFATYSFNRKDVLKAIEVAKEAIKQTIRLQGVVEEEERCFKAFSVWLHYELDKLAQQEGSEVRPNAAFHPVPVSSYITDSLSPQTSPVNPFLTMGLASLSIAQNSAITNGQKWVDQLQLDHSVQEEGSNETLQAMLKRLKEELSGQKERDHVAAGGPKSQEEKMIEVDEFSIEPPFAQPSTTVDEPRPTSTVATQSSPQHEALTSIPILLHFVGKLAGEVMSKAMTRIGNKSTLSERKELGQLQEEEESGRRTQRVRSVVAIEEFVHEAWVSKSSLHISRHRIDALDQIEQTAYNLERSGASIKVFDLEFVDSQQLDIAVEVSGSTGMKQCIATLHLSSLTFSRDPQLDNPPSLPLDNAIALDSTFPPSNISLSTLNGRRLATTLAGEGRRIEFHDFDSSSSPTTTTANGDDMELQ
ncbi:uncharacterized protein JCM6883_004356 [Sporobolomyces salmoneus]|uniref:uncharacterized protein n=1 Tax=Sporobolomyces salmoneus TaxID=183962 RepID=UPI00317B3BC1